MKKKKTGPVKKRIPVPKKPPAVIPSGKVYRRKKKPVILTEQDRAE